ncbi:MAG: flavoprotein, partial [Trueperaceae bacterium]|nr:flavoprotein [Trueperaceae bacterium]
MSGANARPRSSEVTPDRPPRWIVGVTGGLAAVKAPALVRRLREAGAEVRVAATPAVRFVTPLALASAAGGEVLDEAAWFAADGEARHLSFAAWADGLLVAPATADALARIAHGHAGDVVSALALGVPRVALAPAMNPAMWRAAPVRRNVARLRADGREVLEPASGAMGTVGEAPGPGRLPDEAALVEAVLRAPRGRDLEG